MAACSAEGRLGAAPDSASSRLAPPHEPPARRPRPGEAGCATTRPGRPAHPRAGWLPQPPPPLTPQPHGRRLPAPGPPPQPSRLARRCFGSGAACRLGRRRLLLGSAGCLCRERRSESGRQISRSETAVGDGLSQPSSAQQRQRSPGRPALICNVWPTSCIAPSGAL